MCVEVEWEVRFQSSISISIGGGGGCKIEEFDIEVTSNGKVGKVGFACKEEVSNSVVGVVMMENRYGGWANLVIGK